MREVVWVLVLVGLLSGGVVGVLLFNTAMQRQAVHLAAQQQQIQALQVRAQALQSSLQRTADPALLQREALSLHMHPASTVKVVAGTSKHRHRHRHKAVSGR